MAYLMSQMQQPSQSNTIFTLKLAGQPANSQKVTPFPLPADPGVIGRKAAWLFFSVCSINNVSKHVQVNNRKMH